MWSREYTLLNLDELGLQIGSPIQIQLVDDETKRYSVQLIGFVRYEALILSATKTADTDLGLVLKDTQPLILRFMTAKGAVAFRTHIIKKHLTPYPHIHVAIPQEIESVPVETKPVIATEKSVTFINDDESSRPRGVTLTGLSPERIIITDSNRLADAGQSITITMSFRFAGLNNVLVLDGEVEYSEIVEEGGQQITVTLSGLDSSDTILLQALYYEELLKNMNVIDD